MPLVAATTIRTRKALAAAVEKCGLTMGDAFRVDEKTLGVEVPDMVADVYRELMGKSADMRAQEVNAALAEQRRKIAEAPGEIAKKAGR